MVQFTAIDWKVPIVPPANQPQAAKPTWQQKVVAQPQAQQAPQPQAPAQPSPQQYASQTPAYWDTGNSQQKYYQPIDQKPVDQPDYSQPQQLAGTQIDYNRYQQPDQPAKKTALDYQSNDPTRLTEISKNLSQADQSSPDMFKDRASFESNFNYAWRSDAQKQVLDNYRSSRSSKNADTNALYNQLVGGQTIDPSVQNTQWFKDAYNRFSQVQTYSNLSPQAFARLIGDKIIVGSQIWNDISSKNPELVQAAQQEKFKQNAENIVNGTDWLSNDRLKEVDAILDPIKEIMRNLPTVDLKKEFEDNVLNNPKINAHYDTIKTLNEQKNNLNYMLNKAQEDVIASNPWAPESYIVAKSNQNSKAILDQLNYVNDSINNEQSLLNADLEKYKSYYGAIVDDANQKMSTFKTQADYALKAGETISNAYKDQRAAEAAKLKDAQDFAQAKDLKNMDLQYQKAKDANDFNQQVSLAKMSQSFQSSQQNKQFEQQLKLEGIKMANDRDMKSITNDDWTTSTVLFNKSTWATRPIDSSVAPTVAKAAEVCWTDAQCGQFVNQFLKANGQWQFRVWDSLASKENIIKKLWVATKSADIQPWSLFTMPIKWSNTGHTWVVVSNDWNGKITVADYNWNEDGKFWTRQVTADSILNKGGMFSKSIWTPQKPATWPSQDDMALYNTIVASGKFSKQQTAAIKNSMTNGADWMSVVKNQAKELLWATEWQKVTKLENAKTQMTKLDSLLSEYYKNGWSTWIFKWTIEDTAQRLWEVKDPKLRTIAVQISTALQSYRNAISWTAYSEQEWKEISNVFPWINKSQGLNKSIIQWRLSWFESDIDGYYSAVLWDNYWKLKDSQLRKQIESIN